MRLSRGAERNAITSTGSDRSFETARPKTPPEWGRASADPRIDAHHHLWSYTSDDYGWITGEMSSLRRDFLLTDLRAELRASEVVGTVAVQARQTLQETRWLLDLAHQPASPILGVVGWLPLAAPGIEDLLDQVSPDTALKGLRHVVQAEPRGFLEGAAFNAGIAALSARSLVYDILIHAHQLPEAVDFVDRHATQPFVLDHLAKPPIRAGEIDRWRADIQELARRPHVSCKISGMVTEADWAVWTPAQLKPYFDAALEAFGPERLMAGTDWPVLTLGCTYPGWWRIVEDWTAELSPHERGLILGRNALRIYSLQVEPPPADEPPAARKDA